jgi:hypothetical protein
MRTIWQALAWKEWHEHKWKLVSVTAILCGITALFLQDVYERWSLAIIPIALLICIVPLAIFVGLGDAAGERSRGTLCFLQSLPVPTWRVALHKLAFGLFTIMTPLLVTLCIVLVRHGQLGPSTTVAAANSAPDHSSTLGHPFTLGIDSWFVDGALTLSLVAASFYIWTVATGVNRRDEVSAGAVALSAMMSWSVLLLTTWSLLYRTLGPFFQWPSGGVKWLAVLGLATAPGGFTTLAYATDGDRQYLLPALCVMTVTLILLAIRYVCRFGRISDTEIRSPKTAQVGPGPLGWLGPPRRSPFTAIVWKQCRESGPLALVGVAVVIAIVAVIFAVNWHQFNDNVGQLPVFLLVVFAAVSASFGMVVAMIVGIGVFLHDTGPGLNTFWRSRPIRPNLWFWTKFTSGLAIALAAIYGPIVLFAVLFALPGSFIFVTSPDIELANAVNLLRESFDPVILVFPTITIATFAAAAAMTCLVRNAVYAAILSIAVVYIGFLATAFALAVAQLIRSEGSLIYIGKAIDEMSPVQAAAGLLLTFIACTLLAWLAVRNDWGQKAVR